MPPVRHIPPFEHFMEAVTSAKAGHYLKMQDARVEDEASFHEMQSHLIKRYEGVEVKHSFLDDNDQIFDCIPVEQQPSLRGTGKQIASPPALSLPEGHTSGSIEPLLGPGKKDRHGNDRACPPGTIPLRRITLEELVRSRSLREFFQKSPFGGRHPRLGAPRSTFDSATHKYAHAYQTVANKGATNFMTIWTPPIGPNQVFSLSQIWVTAGSGAQLQTVEVGWQVYPAKYNGIYPVLFIFWTPDDYASGGRGCYNLDCSAFVQLSPVSWVLGGTIGQSSVIDGPQRELSVGFALMQGNWWLFVDGGPVGYYPASLFNQGALATSAQDVDFGGETTGNGSWPPMGSGEFAEMGEGQAAYQRWISYWNMQGVNTMADVTPDAETPGFYTIEIGTTIPISPIQPSVRYFYYGGPGGTTAGRPEKEADGADIEGDCGD